MSYLESQNEKYRQHFKLLTETEKDKARAAELSVGGQFERFGKIELALLQSAGFSDEDLLVDVGCGTGRLAVQIARVHKGNYIGTDVVEDMLDYAKNLVDRPDWSFHKVDSITIPAEDSSARIVSFFSVLTHLLHEHSFLYLNDAWRVLVPGGKVICSFLEFHLPSHWAVFENSVSTVDTNRHLNMFIDRLGIQAWAEKIGFQKVEFLDGDKPQVEIDGEPDSLGQSVAILTK